MAKKKRPRCVSTPDEAQASVAARRKPGGAIRALEVVPFTGGQVKLSDRRKVDRFHAYKSIDVRA